MPRIEALSAQFQPGLSITIHRSNGGPVTGVIETIDSDYVVLAVAGRRVVLFENNIDWFEEATGADGAPSGAEPTPASVVRRAVAATEVERPGPRPERPVPSASPTIDAVAPAPATAPETPSREPITPPEAPPAAESKADGVVAPGALARERSIPKSATELRLERMLTDMRARVRLARLALPEPDFPASLPFGAGNSYTVEKEFRRDWNRAREQYRSAMKSGEHGRLYETARILDRLQQTVPPLPQVASHLLLVRLAARTFESAASAALRIREFHPGLLGDDFLAGTLMAAGKPELAHAVLDVHFNDISPTEVTDEWCVYVRLCDDLRRWAGLSSITRRAKREGAAWETVECLYVTAVLASERHEPPNREDERPLALSAVDGHSRGECLSAVLAGTSHLHQGPVASLAAPLRAMPQRIREKAEVQPARIVGSVGSTTRANRPAPRGTGAPPDLYPQAKAAALQKDFGLAKDLYVQAIEARQRHESAILDLAQIYDQEGDHARAVAVLDEYAPLMRSRLRNHRNLLVTVCLRKGDFQRALDVLYELRHQATHAEGPVLMRRMASCQAKLERYEDAYQTLQQVLKQTPNDQVALNLRDSIRRAQAETDRVKRAAIVEEASALAAAADRYYLSGYAQAVLQAFVDRNDFGERRESVRTGHVTRKDVGHFIKTAQTLGPGRATDRAKYNLRAAALIQAFDLPRDEFELDNLLGFAFSAYGDAAVNSNHLESARFYYGEALNYSTEDWVWKRFCLFLDTFVQARIVPRPADEDGLNPKERALRLLERVAVQPNADAAFRNIHCAASGHARIQGMLDETLGSASDHLASALARAPQRIRETLGWASGSGHDWDTVKAHVDSAHRTYVERVKELTQRPLLPFHLDAWTDIFKERSPVHMEVDGVYLDRSNEAIQIARRFLRADGFSPKLAERHALSAHVSTLLEDILERPTRVAFEVYRPFAEWLQARVEQSFAELEERSSPELVLEPEWLEQDAFHVGDDGLVHVRFAVSNRERSSPADLVMLEIGPTASPYFTAPSYSLEVAPNLDGGRKSVVDVAFSPTPLGVNDAAVPLAVALAYEDHRNTHHRTAERLFTVPLGDPSAFVEVPNRFAQIAGGSGAPEDMFFGRKELIERRLVPGLLDPSGTKCYVIHGQARCGKTAVLQELERRLCQDRALTVVLNMRGIPVTVRDFLAAVYQEIFTSVSRYLRERGGSLSGSVPKMHAVRDYGALSFDEGLRQMLESLEQAAGPGGPPRLVLLIDEFTSVYTALALHDRPDDVHADGPCAIPDIWKRLVEKRDFSAVLVAHDTWTAFSRRFGNAFGSTDPIRLEYLDSGEARELVEQPIGEDRYLPGAVEHIVEVCGRNPFYLVMVCDQLVAHMNRQRLRRISRYDVDYVCDAMVRPDRPDDHITPLDRAKFDNLLFAAGQESSVVPGLDALEEAEPLKICRAIAEKGGGGSCEPSELYGSFDRADVAVRDLLSRGVLEEHEGRVRFRVRLFHEWLLKNEWS